MQSVVDGTPHTADEPMNMFIVGTGLAQLPSRLAVYAFGEAAPASVFSLIKIVAAGAV